MRWFLITSTALCFMCSLNICLTDQRTKFGGRIVGGNEAEHSQYPYVVALRVEKESNETNSKTPHRCTGAILSPNLVLTAAHCLYSNVNNKFVEPQFVTVIAGAEKSMKDGVRILAHEFVPHPKYEKQSSRVLNRGYDVAIVILQSPLDYNENVNEIALGDSMDSWDEITKTKGTECLTLGYGRTHGNATKSSDVLMVAATTPFRPAGCKKMYCGKNSNGKVNRVMCRRDFAGFGEVCSRSSDSSTCKGDSGGPLVCNDRVWGVSSYGKVSCAAGSPNVFANLRLIKEVWDHLWNNPTYAESAQHPQNKSDPVEG